MPGRQKEKHNERDYSMCKLTLRRHIVDIHIEFSLQLITNTDSASERAEFCDDIEMEDEVRGHFP